MMSWNQAFSVIYRPCRNFITGIIGEIDRTSTVVTVVPNGDGDERNTLGSSPSHLTASRLTHTNVTKAAPVQRRHIL